MIFISEKVRRIVRDPETRRMTLEYYELSGKHFPLFNYDNWYTIDDWYKALTEALEKLRAEKTNDAEHGNHSKT